MGEAGEDLRQLNFTFLTGKWSLIVVPFKLSKLCQSWEGRRCAEVRAGASMSMVQPRCVGTCPATPYCAWAGWEARGPGQTHSP